MYICGRLIHINYYSYSLLCIWCNVECRSRHRLRIKWAGRLRQHTTHFKPHCAASVKFAERSRKARAVKQQKNSPKHRVMTTRNVSFKSHIMERRKQLHTRRLYTLGSSEKITTVKRSRKRPFQACVYAQLTGREDHGAWANKKRLYYVVDVWGDDIILLSLFKHTLLFICLIYILIT